MTDAFDLDAFLPAPIRFTRAGTNYRLDGDPDVDTVARMLKAETAITEAAQLPVEERVAAIVEATAAGKQLIVDMLLEHDPAQNAAGLKLSTQDVLTLFALIMHGGSVASVVAQAMSVPAPDLSGAAETVATDDDAVGEGEAAADAAPLALAGSSSATSSGSGSGEDGDPGIGSA